jgi:hypothetical protein
VCVCFWPYAPRDVRQFYTEELQCREGKRGPAGRRLGSRLAQNVYGCEHTAMGWTLTNGEGYGLGHHKHV